MEVYGIGTETVVNPGICPSKDEAKEESDDTEEREVADNTTFDVISIVLKEDVTAIDVELLITRGGLDTE